MEFIIVRPILLNRYVCWVPGSVSPGLTPQLYGAALWSQCHCVVPQTSNHIPTLQVWAFMYVACDNTKIPIFDFHCFQMIVSFKSPTRPTSEWTLMKSTKPSSRSTLFRMLKLQVSFFDHSKSYQQVHVKDLIHSLQVCPQKRLCNSGSPTVTKPTTTS